MKYLIMYLPIEGVLEDGDIAVNQQGDAVKYSLGMLSGTLRPAAPFVVAYEYNERRIVGRVSEVAMKWLKNKQEIPQRCVSDVVSEFVSIACPTCGAKH